MPVALTVEIDYNHSKASRLLIFNMLRAATTAAKVARRYQNHTGRGRKGEKVKRALKSAYAAHAPSWTAWVLHKIGLNKDPRATDDALAVSKAIVAAPTMLNYLREIAKGDRYHAPVEPSGHLKRIRKAAKRLDESKICGQEVSVHARLAAIPGGAVIAIFYIIFRIAIPMRRLNLPLFVRMFAAMEYILVIPASFTTIPGAMLIQQTKPSLRVYKRVAAWEGLVEAAKMAQQNNRMDAFHKVLAEGKGDSADPKARKSARRLVNLILQHGTRSEGSKV